MYTYKCIWLIPDYVFLFPSEFRDLAVRRVTRRIKKTVYILSCRRRIFASPDRKIVHSHIADRQQFLFNWAQVKEPKLHLQNLIQDDLST